MRSIRSNGSSPTTAGHTSGSTTTNWRSRLRAAGVVYRIWFGWEEELACIMMSCALDMQVPEASIKSVHSLLAFVNERLWVGHFDVFADENVPTFRQAILLNGQGYPTEELLGDVIDITISECERFLSCLPVRDLAGQVRRGGGAGGDHRSRR